MMRRINDWAKRLVLCFLSFVMVFSMASETVHAEGRDMYIWENQDPRFRYSWDYIIDRDDVKGRDVLFPSSGGTPYVVKLDKTDNTYKAKIGFFVLDTQNNAAVKGFRMFLGKYVFDEYDANGKPTRSHLEKIDAAPGAKNGFYYTSDSGKIEISLTREDLPKVTDGEIDDNGNFKDVHPYQIRIQKYGEGGGYWILGTAYDLELTVLGVYHNLYGIKETPPGYTNTDYWKGEQWGAVVYDLLEDQRPILAMELKPYEVPKDQAFDLKNQDELRKLVVSYTERQGKELTETTKLSAAEKVHPVELRDVLQRNSSEHYIIYEALNVTPVGDTPALKPNQTVLTEPGEYKIQLRGFFDGKQSNERTNRYVTKETTIKIPFPDVIPEKDKQGNTNRWPDNYVPVTFVSDGNGTLTGMTKYYVNPEKAVDLTSQADAITKTPKVGYKATGKWTPEQLKDTFTSPSEFVFHFDPYDDVIPAKSGVTEPDGYSVVTFKADENGSLEGITKYFVNPTKEVDLTNEANLITKKPKTGYQASGTWDPALVKQQYSGDKEFTFHFDPYKDVIPADPGVTKPDGYVTVTFKTDGNGTLGGKTEYYVNPNKQVILNPPTTTGNTGYVFRQWSQDVTKSTQYRWNTTVTAYFTQIPAVQTKPTPGYVKVDFALTGNGGSIKSGQTTTYYVDPNRAVTLTPPQYNTEIGYRFDKWDPNPQTARTYTTPTKINGTFTALDDVIEAKPGVTKPNGYVKVTFRSDGNGTLTGAKEYYVNSTKSVDLTPKADALTKTPNVGYQATGTWDPAELTGTFTTDKVFTFRFNKYADVIKEVPGETRPDGYVTVRVIPTEKATDETIESYWVKKDTQVTLPVSEPVGKQETDANNITRTYHFTGWKVTKGTVASWPKPNSGTTKIADKFIQDTDITAQYSASTAMGDLIAAPVPKKNVESLVDGTLKPEDLIANLPGSGEGSLPEGTTFAFAPGGNPDLSKAGTTKAEVVVTYPKGNTVTVSVPVKVIAGKPTAKPVYTYVGRIPTPEDYKKVITPAKGAEILSIGITEYPDVSKPSTPESPAIGKVVVNYKDGSTHYLDVPVVVYDNVIPAKPDGERPDGTPKNYVKVTMDPTDHAEDPTKQIFYVNPEVAVTLTVTDPVGKTGYEFGSWEKDVRIPTKYDVDEVIKAQFNELGDVLTEEKPGYVKVDFAIEGEGGKIKEGETTTYYVNPSKEVTLKAPVTEAEVGFTFNTWTPNPTTPTKYETETTIKGTFTALPDIIPNVDENGQPNVQPNGYIPVEFKPGNHGALEGITLYWVKPGVEVTVPAPTPKANTNYAFTSWDKSLTLTAAEGQQAITITAQWKSTYKPPTPDPNKPDPNKPDPNNPDPNNPDPNKPGTTPSGDVNVDGKARQDVAANISKTYFPNAKKVIVVQNKAYADSMSAMNVSQGNIPILYTGRDTLFPVTMREILRVPREEIIVMGGEGTISDQVFRELQGLSSAKVTRIGGADRFEVNRNSAKYMPDSTTAVIASGMIYTDALSSVPYAHALHAPILLVRQDSVPQAVQDVLYDRMTSAVIIGGPGTVSPATKSQLEKIIGTSIERIGGTNRYVVSAAVAGRLQNVQHAIITSGELWSDALVAGPIAQRLNAPVLLTPYGGLREGAYNYLLANPDLKSVITVGGPGSIGQGVRNQVKAIFGSNKQWNLDPAQAVSE
ncbi:cell wall-binding repeat-containing protein [Murdochiella sp. Marseille-P8839]|nr:cell wall-binding repeat-containing protein [Murdochiella sp. Marseille-P8839]